MCGKTVDMKAVLDSNNQVIGVECSTVGIEAFFQENNIEYAITNDKYKTYKVYFVGSKISILVVIV